MLNPSIRAALLSLILIAFAPLRPRAQSVPTTINDQGRLTDNTPSQAAAEAPLVARPPVAAKGRGNPWVSFADGVPLPSHAAAAGDTEGVAPARPLALAAGDFDEDGVPDLVTSLADDSGGLVSIRKGNLDVSFPNGPEAQKRRQKGAFVDSPFLGTIGSLRTSLPLDLLGAGDFDNDGKWDVVGVATGEPFLWLLHGDGHGRLGREERIALPGPVTAMTVGEINRADGLADVVVGVNAPDGPKLLVFEGPEGALRFPPEMIALPAPASGLALGLLDGEYHYDLAIGAGTHLLVVRGRDRQLSGSEPARLSVAKAVVDEISIEGLNSPIVSVAVGDFLCDEKHRADIAFATASGGIRVTTLDGKRSETLASGGSRRTLVAAKVSTMPVLDLLALDGKDNRIEIVTSLRTGEGAERSNPPPPPRAEDFRFSRLTSLETAGAPVALLPMRLNDDALFDLVVLTAGSTEASTVVTQPMATYAVTNTNDSGAGSLRQAILNANASAGLDTITFSIGSGAVTIQPASALPIVTDSTTFDATTQPGYVGAPVIGLSGASLPNNIPIIKADYAAYTIRGFDFYYAYTDLHLLGATFSLVTANIFEDGLDLESDGCLIGGTAPGTGNQFFGAAHSCSIFCENIGSLFIEGSSNLVRGNLFGTDGKGNDPLGDGIAILAFGSNNNTIGGTTPGSRNVIAGVVRSAPDVFEPDGIANTVTLYGSGDLLQGNYIGTDVTGTLSLGNEGTGVDIKGSETVGGTAYGAGNLISGNGDDRRNPNGAAALPGIVTEPGTFWALVQGNLIGVDAGGTVALPNRGAGIVLGGGDGTVGGNVAAARNVISGNGTDGITVASGDTNDVLGNYIGVDPTGTRALPNGGNGVHLVGGTNSSIGFSASTRNVISGNAARGIRVDSVPSPVYIQGNFIGTNAAGTAAIPNAGDGIFVYNSSPVNIGIAGGGNLISGNFGDGIEIDGTSSYAAIFGNLIGTNASFTGALGNGGSGVRIDGALTVVGSPGNTSNTIAYNGGAGVSVVSSDGSVVSGNSFVANAGLGIDLGPPGVTPNDAGDADSGPNHLQNFPILSYVLNPSGSTIVGGSLASTPNTNFTIDFYSSPACDPSGYGEGKLWLGSQSVTTDGSGNATVGGSFAVTTPNGWYVTSTATYSGLLSGTSEFSPCAPVSAAFLIYETSSVTGGNGNPVLEANECANLSVTVRNLGNATVSGLSATLSTSTAGIAITQPSSSFAAIAPGATATTQVPFGISTSSLYGGCPPSVTDFTMTVTGTQGTYLVPFRFDGSYVYSQGNPVPIPDNGAAVSQIAASGFTSSLAKVVVNVHVTHTFDADLALRLVGPDLTTVFLTQNRGGGGDNYGQDCPAGANDTTFDDSAAIPVSSGSAPFIGSFRPEQALSAFYGKSGAAVNDVWGLYAVDSAGGDTGNIECWTLKLYPYDCALGAGGCSALPDEAKPLVWTPGSKSSLEWGAAAGATGYNVYQGVPADLPNLLNGNADSCRTWSTTNLTTGNVMNSAPAPGSFYWYIVRAVSAAGDGPAGFSSSGKESLESRGSCP